MDEPLLRADLLAGYERPYARWLPVAYRANNVPQAATASGVMVAASIVTAIALRSGAPGSLLVLTALVVALSVIWTAWVTVVGAQVIRRRITDWTPVDSGLARVRARRAHAGAADREVVHDEFAVAVDDAGHLVTWRFRPLPANEIAPQSAIVLPGAPTYVASEAGRVPFDPTDAGLAAEQLSEAQERAATLEADAAADARAALGEAERRHELRRETESTAEALRRHTGQ